MLGRRAAPVNYCATRVWTGTDGRAIFLDDRELAGQLGGACQEEGGRGSRRASPAPRRPPASASSRLDEDVEGLLQHKQDCGLRWGPQAPDRCGGQGPAAGQWQGDGSGAWASEGRGS